MTQVLVTGGGGFVGSHLVDRLLQDGHEVRVLDSFATGRRENLAHVAEDIELVEGDVQSDERVRKAMRGCEYVFHQAALPAVARSIEDPLMTHAVNVMGSLNVLLAAREEAVRRVVFASSSSVYGTSAPLPKEESMTAVPTSPYAVSKLAAEGYCRSFSLLYQLECVALRYFNVFGPRQDPHSQYSAVIPRFIHAALNGQRPVIFDDGEQSRDFTYVANVVEANIRAMVAPDVAGEVFNVACGERWTLNQTTSLIAEITGESIVPEYRPARKGEVRHSHASIDKARIGLRFTPQVGFAEGLRRTIDSSRHAPGAAR